MSLVGKVMVFKGGSFSGHKRDFVAALATAQFGEDQAPGNDAAGSGASGRGRKQKATAEGVEMPAKKAAKKAAKKDEDDDQELAPLSDEAAARIEKRASSMTVEEMIYGVKNTRPV